MVNKAETHMNIFFSFKEEFGACECIMRYYYSNHKWSGTFD